MYPGTEFPCSKNLRQKIFWGAICTNTMAYIPGLCATISQSCWSICSEFMAFIIKNWSLLFILIIVCQFMSNDSQHDQSFLNISLFNCSGSINLQILYSQSVFSISSSDFSLTQLLIYWADFTLYWYIYIIFRFFRVGP